MPDIFFLQVQPQSAAGTTSYYVHLIILGVIMVGSGLLGGFTGYLMEKNKKLFSDPESIQKYQAAMEKQLRYFLVTGLCASLLIPLFLSTISSQLMSEAQKDPLKYFVFGGFCLLVAVFSKQFITSLSEKMLKEIKDEVTQQATEKVEKEFEKKSEQITQQVEEQVSKQTLTIQNKLSVWDEFTKLESELKHPTNPKVLNKEDLIRLLDSAIATGDKDLPAQLYDRISILCFEKKDYDLMEEIKEAYQDRIDISHVAWADLAVVNMNLYHNYKIPRYKIKSEEYIRYSLEKLSNYGVPYAIAVYLLMIDYDNLVEGDPKESAVKEEARKVIAEIINQGKVTTREAYNYIMLNENTTFNKYNAMLKQLFPEEWKTLEKNSEKKEGG